MNKRTILTLLIFFFISLIYSYFIFSRASIKAPLIDSIDKFFVSVGLKDKQVEEPIDVFYYTRYNKRNGELSWDMFLPYPSTDGYSLNIETSDGNDFFIYHNTDYDISNCDMGEWVEGSDSLVGQENETLKDLEWKITHYYDDIETVFKEKNPNTADQYLQNGKLVASDESGLKEVIIGPYEGIEQYIGVEGCGEYRYYLRTVKGTMYATRYITQAFTPIRPNYLENLALPGIITPNEEEAFFYKVISSIEIIEE